jgi:hypothetical protein
MVTVQNKVKNIKKQGIRGKHVVTWPKSGQMKGHDTIIKNKIRVES